MRVAVVSDIHSNRHALDVVLDEVQTIAPDLIINLGDTVGYNAHPRACWRRIAGRAHVNLLGNHDLAALPPDARPIFDPSGELARPRAMPLAESPDRPGSEATRAEAPGQDALLARFNPLARAAVLFARRDLATPDLDALAALSPRSSLVRDPVRIDAFHASPSDTLWEYVLPHRAQATLELHLERADPIPESRRLVLVGHTHVPCEAVVQAPPVAAAGSGRTRAGAGHRVNEPTTGSTAAPRDAARARLVNPGSVGQPRDGDPRASFALLDLERDTVEIRRVAYDVEAAAADVRAAGLPKALADRLRFGR